MWMSSSEDEVDSDASRDDTNFQSTWQLVFFLMLWQSVFRISNMAMEVLLKSLSLLLNLLRNHPFLMRKALIVIKFLTLYLQHLSFYLKKQG